jgi:hypothetical protein
LVAAGLVDGGLVGDVVLEVRPGFGGWGIGQGDGVPLGPSLRWCSSLGGRMLMERSHLSASLGQFSSGALGGCMPKPWPPVA